MLFPNLDFGFDALYPASIKLAFALVLAGQVWVWLGSALHRLAFYGIISAHAAAPTKSRMTELPKIKQPNLKQPMPDQATAVSETKPKPILQSQCPSCGWPENIVWVHGHGQCAHCRMNVMPCCDGETCAAS